MSGDVLNQVVRAVVLVLMLGWFSVSFARGLLDDEHGRSFGPVRQGAGQDPGVRVLLVNRPPEANDSLTKLAREPKKTWERLEIAILQPVDVVTPNLPDDADHRQTVRAGSYLRIEPDGTDGMVLSSPEWGKQLNWPVTIVRVIPRSTKPEAIERTDPRDGKLRPIHPALRDPTQFEAADTQAVFALANGYRYRGSLELIFNTAKDLVAVNCLPMEGYVEGVVAVEMSPSYPLEALKAQAILSRGSAYAKQLVAMTKAGKDTRAFDLLDTLDDQEYRGTGTGGAAVVRAVQDTRGIVTMVRGLPFAALFCASSGGYTEAIDHVLPDARDVYGRIPLSLLMPAQRDDQCQPGAEALGVLGSHWQTTVTLKPTDIQRRLSELLATQGRQIGYINRIKVGRRDPRSNRVATVIIQHTLGDAVEVSGHDFRMMMGPQALKSTLWSEDSPKMIDDPAMRGRKLWSITCFGYGHGVGLSQVSAYLLAKQGQSASVILQTFYGPLLELRSKW